MLSLQWFCKTAVLDSTFSKLKVLYLSVFSRRATRKICWMSQQGTEKSIFRVIFQISFDVITTMILQNTNTKFNLLWIKSVYSWVYYPGEHKKICWVSQQEPEKSIFKLDLMLLLQWFCKTPLPDSTYFEFKTLIPWCATLDSHKKEKKNVDCRSKDWRRAF